MGTNELSSWSVKHIISFLSTAADVEFFSTEINLKGIINHHLQIIVVPFNSEGVNFSRY